MRTSCLFPLVLSLLIWTVSPAQEGKESVRKAEQSAATVSDSDMQQSLDESIDDSLLRLEEMMVDAPSAKATLDACESFMDHYGIRDDRASYQKMADHWLTHTRIGEDFILYHRLLIESVEKDAVIFTNASEDSYPLLAMTVRGHEQKSVIPSYWISDPSFDPTLFGFNGFPQGEDIVTSIRMFADANPNRPIHLALTMPHEVLEEFKDESVINGLSIALHASGKAERNLRKTYHKLSVKRKDFDGSPLASNFLPVLIAMHGIASSSGDDAVLNETSLWGKEILRDIGQPITWEELTTGR